MLMKVKTPFPYAIDRAQVVMLEKGEIRDIDDSVIEGLHDEGFIEEPTDAELEALQEGAVVIERAPVEIPADWASLPWFKLQRLAKALGAPAKVTKPAAIALIEAEVAARAD